MKKAKRYISLALILTMGVTLSSCSDKTASKKTTGNSTDPITGTTSGSTTGSSTSGSTSGGGSSSCPYGSGYEPGVADSGQTFEYYKLNSPPVVAHGADGGEIVFSSASDLPSNYNQNIFFSDSRFNVRVIPRYQRGGTDSKGRSCDYYSPRPFKKMNIEIVVRSRQSSPGVGDTYKFRDVPVDCPSRVREFQVPATSDPLIIEVRNVEWDYSCEDYIQQGFDRAYLENLGFCPYDRVWTTECYQLEVQFSTDTTKDLPGPRVN